MKNNSHFFEQLNDAVAQGFTHHFQFLSCGSIRCIGTSKQYSIEEVVIVSESCTNCRTTFYCIDTADGLKGTAIEHWDI